MDIKCEACQDGIMFGYSCWHCQKDWTEKFFEEIQENNFDKEDVIKRLGWLGQEIEESEINNIFEHEEIKTLVKALELLNRAEIGMNNYANIFKILKGGLKKEDG